MIRSSAMPWYRFETKNNCTWTNMFRSNQQDIPVCANKPSSSNIKREQNCFGTRRICDKFDCRIKPKPTKKVSVTNTEKRMYHSATYANKGERNK